MNENKCLLSLKPQFQNLMKKKKRYILKSYVDEMFLSTIKIIVINQLKGV